MKFGQKNLTNKETVCSWKILNRSLWGGVTPYINILIQLAPNFSWSLNLISSSYHSDINFEI